MHSAQGASVFQTAAQNKIIQLRAHDAELPLAARGASGLVRHVVAWGPPKGEGGGRPEAAHAVENGAADRVARPLAGHTRKPTVDMHGHHMPRLPRRRRQVPEKMRWPETTLPLPTFSSTSSRAYFLPPTTPLLPLPIRRTSLHQ